MNNPAPQVLYTYEELLALPPETLRQLAADPRYKRLVADFLGATLRRRRKEDAWAKANPGAALVERLKRRDTPSP